MGMSTSLEPEARVTRVHRVARPMSAPVTDEPIALPAAPRARDELVITHTGALTTLLPAAESGLYQVATS